MLSIQERSGVALAVGATALVGGSVAASDLVSSYPVLGGQGVRYLAAALLLLAWSRIRRVALPRPTRREWGWLAALGAVGMAGCSVLMIEATRVGDPGSVGVVIGAAPLVIVLVGSVAARRRPSGRLLVAALVVTAGAGIAQFGAGGGAVDPLSVLLSLGALGGAVGMTVLAAPVLPRLGSLAATVYSCALAGVMLLVAGSVVGSVTGTDLLRMPTPAEWGALTYLAVLVTAVVCVAWFASMDRLGAARTGLFNGVIPVAGLAAVTLVGVGHVTVPQVGGALAVLAGVLLGLTAGPTGQPAAGVGSLRRAPENATRH
ncbi:DMT family transporter [Nakamurella sp.]|uniref:DMT family transporter n=1 Tax=Nakamurella sp. TaxID=1869182 RepID=UPI0037848AB4